MRNLVRWAVIVLSALAVIGLLVWARGPEHHRGNEVGSFGVTAGLVAVA